MATPNHTSPKASKILQKYVKLIYQLIINVQELKSQNNGRPTDDTAWIILQFFPFQTATRFIDSDIINSQQM